jgi:NAD(P)-dependent dehydrogenase (short-subunit alcohol dehydrogenase family)
VKRLADRVAIITGGASGIGAATVRLFAAQGARILVADMQEDRGKQLAESLGEAVDFRRVDVTREEDVKGAVEQAVDRWGRPDVIPTTRFGGALGPIEGTTVEEFDSPSTCW